MQNATCRASTSKTPQQTELKTIQTVFSVCNKTVVGCKSGWNLAYWPFNALFQSNSPFQPLWSTFNEYSGLLCAHCCFLVAADNYRQDVGPNKIPDDRHIITIGCMCDAMLSSLAILVSLSCTISLSGYFFYHLNCVEKALFSHFWPFLATLRSILRGKEWF